MRGRGVQHALRRQTHGGVLSGAALAALDATADGAQGEDGAPATGYALLARVSIRHTFYNASGGACRDFDVRPTDATAEMLAGAGMLFRPEADGFSVLYDATATDRLLSWLRSRVDRYGAWTRMSFLLSLRNPGFVGFTDIPVGTNPSSENFYFTNREAHAWGRATLLTPGTRVTAGQLVRVTGPQLVEYVEEPVLRVKVRALSGETVLCRPRCVTAEAAATRPPDQLRCCDPEAPGGDPECDEVTGGKNCSEALYFDLSTLPEDLYRVEKVVSEGPPPPEARYLYTSLYPMTLCLVDLLFSNPDGGEKGIYPVTLETGAVAGVRYTLRFTRRTTWWNYYVLPRDPRGALYDLRIRHVTEPGGPRVPRVRFLGPCEVSLPGAPRAWRFVSSRPLPLEQRPTLHLRLTGRTGAMTHPDVLMEWLPVAPPGQVLPVPPPAAWAQARATRAGPGPPGCRCGALLRRLHGSGPDPRGRAGSGGVPPPACYSDIFVHV